MSLESHRLLKQQLLPDRKTLYRAISLAGYILLIGSTASYMQANYRSLHNTQDIFSKSFGSDAIGVAETCIVRAPLTLNDCSGYWGAGPSVIDALYKHQLALFSQPTQAQLLPDDYEPGDVIVFDSQEMDLHPFINRIWFPDTPDTLFHIVPENRLPEFQVQNEITVQDLSKLTQITAPRIWYITANGNTDKDAFSELINKDYVSESEITDGRLQIVKYQRG